MGRRRELPSEDEVSTAEDPSYEELPAVMDIPDEVNEEYQPEQDSQDGNRVIQTQEEVDPGGEGDGSELPEPMEVGDAGGPGGGGEPAGASIGEPMDSSGVGESLDASDGAEE